MSRLPVIVGFGGYNAAGRSSFHHGFRRTVQESLEPRARQETLAGLAQMMKLVRVVDGQYQDQDGQPLSLAEIESRYARQILAGTLVRRIEKQHLDPDAAHWQKSIGIAPANGASLSFVTQRKQLPEPLPANWSVEELEGNEVRITLHDSCEFKVDSYRPLAVKSAGQLPTGFEPSELYNARFHPRARGPHAMPADFINAYVLGSVGTTGSITGACATFLYNLQKGIEQIAAGKARVVIVGSSEAPINQECIEGYGAMGALATEEGLRQIEGKSEVDFRRASRPFGDNCGFTLAEACQFVVLMDDELALELGADIHGAVPDVFINADGFKKSISAPGPGNYLTVAKAVASAVQLLGLDAVRQRSFVHAHGSSTPANRVTESEI